MKIPQGFFGGGVGVGVGVRVDIADSQGFSWNFEPPVREISDVSTCPSCDGQSWLESTLSGLKNKGGD